MKIMWVSNILLPNFAEKIGQKPFYGGGWMVAMANSIAKDKNNNLVICAPYNGKKIVCEKIDDITYYAFPSKKIKQSWEYIIGECNPNIVHLHGTEFDYGYILMNLFPNIKYVISIQGLVSIYAEHFFANLPQNVINGKTIVQILLNDSIKNSKKDFEKRGKIEQKIIQNALHVIGRTNWDKGCVYNINKKAKYHYCGESLREAFYNEKWDINECEKNSIFISQATYPIKGFHMFLHAFKDLIKNYPNAKVYVAGKNIIKNDKLIDKFKKRYYDNYIFKLIKKYNIEKNVIFTGPLNEKEQCDRMRKSHVVVSPSAIENSPNSIGEALCLGVPVIASNVGGVSDLITDKVEGLLYPFNEFYMLAYYIEQVFMNDDLSQKLSFNGKIKSEKLYNNKVNLKTLLDIYKKINII